MKRQVEWLFVVVDVCYDSLGNIPFVSRSGPGASVRTVSLSNNSRGNPLSGRWPDGTTVAYDYDVGANLSSVVYPDNALSFGYDADGLLVSASNALGMVTNLYDAATGWLDASKGADGTWVSYARSDGGAVTSMTSVTGTTAYSLDVARRRTCLATPSAAFDFGYCGWNGRLAAVTNASGFVVQYAYDIMDRVTNISWRTTSVASLGGFAYEYDALGRITSRSHVLGDPSQPSSPMSQSSQKTYAYDDFDRLASDGDVAYTYDAAGNRMTRTEDGETITYTLGAGDRLASWTGGAYTHDAAGNVTHIERDGRPTLDLTWNSQYQLVSVSTNGVFVEGYAYDALSRRVSTTTLEGTTRHVYDDNWQVIADIDEQGNIIASYVWGEGIDKLLAVAVGGSTYYALTDIQGTVWGYVDSQNNVVARWQYDAWGNVISEYVVPSASALARIRYRFQGREWSAATGLINFRMRWYDAETGRWLSKDPIGISGGLNLYAFCGGDALNYLDSNGCGKIKIFTLTVKGIRKYISRDSAKKILKTGKGATVTVEGKGVNKKAKRLAEEVTEKRVVRHDPHREGCHSHYQPKSGGFHVNVPCANIGVTMLGDGFLGNAVDFFNPLSDIQDIFDIVEELSDWQNGE